MREAHVGAIENIVSFVQNLNSLFFVLQKLLGFEQKEIEAVFKEETNKRRSDIYEIY